MRYLSTLLLLFLIAFANAQEVNFQQPVSINELGDPIHQSAILDVSSTTKGVLVPRLTVTEYNAIPSPATGLLVYDETNDVFVFYNGTNWVTLGGGGAGTDDQTLSFSGTTLSIEDGNEVNLGSLQDGVDDADADPTNELQDLSLSGTDLSISDGSTIDIAMDHIVNADGSNQLRVNSGGLIDSLNLFLDTLLGYSIFREEGKSTRSEFPNNGWNILIGDDAGENTEFTPTTFFGQPGNENVFIGKDAGLNNVTGRNNVYLGTSSGRNNISGNRNIMIGKGAGAAANANSNTMVGNEAGFSMEGSDNTILGASAGDGHRNGFGNTILGVGAGYHPFAEPLDTLSGSIFIGRNAGFGELNSNRLYIDNDNDGGMNAFIYGELDNEFLNFNAQVRIRNEYSFPNTDGTAGQFLGTNGSGILSWQTLNKTILEDADSDTKIQVEENSDDDAIRFDIGGIESLIMKQNANGSIMYETISSDNNIFIGTSSGSMNNPSGTEGRNNLFLGNLSGQDNVSGKNNVFMGNESGGNNTSGDNNVFIGYRTGNSNLDAVQNTLIGSNAAITLMSGGNNTIIGAATAVSQTTGERNVYLGTQAGNAKTSGDRNVLIGFNAGLINGSGSRNVFIGNEAGGNETGSDKLYIENTDSSTPLVYGEFDNDLLRINGELQIAQEYAFPTADGSTGQFMTTDGFGNTSWASIPSQTLSFNSPSLSISNGNSVNLEFDEIADADGTTKIQVEEGANDNIIRFDAASTEIATMTNQRMTLKHPSSGTASTLGFRLLNSGSNGNYWNFYTVNGGGDAGALYLFSRTGGNSRVFEIEHDGDVWAKSYNLTSDVHQKQNIKAIDPQKVLQAIEQLPISKWQYIGEDEYHIGPMAQDFYSAFGTGKSNKSINLIDGQGVALAAIQALKQENDALKNEIKMIKDQLNRLLQD